MANNFYAKYSAESGAGGVSSINGLNGAITLAAGTGITLTPVGNTITVAATASGANTALSNLASVAINLTLLPGTTNSIDLGSAAKIWRTGYVGTLKDASDVDALSVTSRILYDTAGRTSVIANRFLVDTLARTSLNWQDRSLSAINGALVMKWDAGSVEMLAGAPLKWNGATSGNISIGVPATITDYSLTMPSATGSAGQVLATDGNNPGQLSWVTNSSAASGSFTTVDLKTVTVVNGIITSIV